MFDEKYKIGYGTPLPWVHVPDAGKGIGNGNARMSGRRASVVRALGRPGGSGGGRRPGEAAPGEVGRGRASGGRMEARVWGSAAVGTRGTGVAFVPTYEPLNEDLMAVSILVFNLRLQFSAVKIR